MRRLARRQVSGSASVPGPGACWGGGVGGAVVAGPQRRRVGAVGVIGDDHRGAGTLRPALHRDGPGLARADRPERGLQAILLAGVAWRLDPGLLPLQRAVGDRAARPLPRQPLQAVAVGGEGSLGRVVEEERGGEAGAGREDARSDQARAAGEQQPAGAGQERRAAPGADRGGERPRLEVAADGPGVIAGPAERDRGTLQPGGAAPAEPDVEPLAVLLGHQPHLGVELGGAGRRHLLAGLASPGEGQRDGVAVDPDLELERHRPPGHLEGGGHGAGQREEEEER
jgi:hypothetical protein